MDKDPREKKAGEGDTFPRFCSDPLNFDVGQVIRYLEKVEEEKRKATLAFVEEVKQELREFNWQDYPIERVYLYGSFVSGQIFADSDVDIAIEGDLGDKYFNVYGKLADYLGMDLDFHYTKDLPFWDRVLKKGEYEVIYERKGRDTKSD